MMLATNILLAIWVASTPLAVWLAWTLRDLGPDNGGGDEQIDLSWSPDPGGLEIDWDAELASLTAAEPIGAIR